METDDANAYEKNPAWFKSYYVVWKQEDEENKKDKQTSLNRTM